MGVFFDEDKLMINTMRAYLQTEGQLDYRECQIAYYTYSMFDTPNKYRVNVNVHIQSPKSEAKKTLNIDDSFDVESEAINFGIEQGKKFIDTNYESGHIVISKPEDKAKSNLALKPTTPPAKQEPKKKDQR